MVAIGLAIAIEALMILLFLSLGSGKPPGETKDGAIVVVNVEPDVAEPPAEPVSPEREPPVQQDAVAPSPSPAPSQPPPPAAPAPSRPIPLPFRLPAAPAIPTGTSEPAPPAPPAGPVYGPSDRFRTPVMPDTQRVGTAPNGEPLYAAAWHREPSDAMLRDYMSTAREPGWGMIACKTAPNYRVEDCVAMAEYPERSQISRALLAAAWEFRVRPPSIGGRPLIGTWVRIRIDYERRQQ